MFLLYFLRKRTESFQKTISTREGEPEPPRARRRASPRALRLTPHRDTQRAQGPGLQGRSSRTRDFLKLTPTGGQTGSQECRVSRTGVTYGCHAHIMTDEWRVEPRAGKDSSRVRVLLIFERSQHDICSLFR